MNLSFQKLFYAIATAFLLFAILVFAKSILIPLSIALLLSFILLPLTKRFEKWKIAKTLSAFLTIFTVILIIGGVTYFFSTQVINVAQEFTHFQDKVIRAFADVTLFINKHVSFMENLEKGELFNRMKGWLTDSRGFLVSKTVSNSATFIAGLLATIVFTFLFLIYRKGLTKAFLAFSPESKREKVLKMFKSVQQVGQKYLFGMVILTVIIGLANSIGLLIIGIDNPFLFGFLGAALAIIPYIGTTMGAVIPVIYAFVSFDSIWMAVAVAILFWAVQLVSDNFITPRIVGGSININALTAILSLIVGAVLWGIAGMILFLPFAAMLKVVCEEYEELKPIALLIGNKNYQENDGSNKFVNKWVDKIKDWLAKFHIPSKKVKNATHKPTNKEV
ncbi:AI-2E family transporter [Labilibaculum sp. K2S]|uniref:AI-2E family transporter n=1 Tax=Labilibaculum sp. K2S TaxID=3056386 RepID=UPI0025A4A02C|nr:AI-2E family transporter [Labilibaculum sp. K2S]MDM8159702.1 AI-2E family transporter [Labilibaculum sp. K2S]